MADWRMNARRDHRRRLPPEEAFALSELLLNQLLPGQLLLSQLLSLAAEPAPRRQRRTPRRGTRATQVDWRERASASRHASTTIHEPRDACTIAQVRPRTDTSERSGTY